MAAAMEHRALNPRRVAFKLSVRRKTSVAADVILLGRAAEKLVRLPPPSLSPDAGHGRLATRLSEPATYMVRLPPIE
ncbi:MAG: hypothetical protein R3C99_03410 [Pirellulaceae bacterium]